MGHLRLVHLGLVMRTQVRAQPPWEWIQTLEPPLNALTDGDGSLVASELYQPIRGLADLPPL